MALVWLAMRPFGGWLARNWLFEATRQFERSIRRRPFCQLLMGNCVFVSVIGHWAKRLVDFRGWAMGSSLITCRSGHRQVVDLEWLLSLKCWWNWARTMDQTLFEFWFTFKTSSVEDLVHCGIGSHSIQRTSQWIHEGDLNRKFVPNFATMLLVQSSTSWITGIEIHQLVDAPFDARTWMKANKARAIRHIIPANCDPKLEQISLFTLARNDEKLISTEFAIRLWREIDFEPPSIGWTAAGVQSCFGYRRVVFGSTYCRSLPSADRRPCDDHSSVDAARSVYSKQPKWSRVFVSQPSNERIFCARVQVNDDFRGELQSVQDNEELVNFESCTGFEQSSATGQQWHFCGVRGVRADCPIIPTHTLPFAVEFESMVRFGISGCCWLSTGKASMFRFSI